MDIGNVGRVPPQSVAAEQSVLGCLMLTKEIHDDIFAILGSVDFYRDDNKEIYEAIKQLASENKPVDVITVSEKLIERGTLETCGGLENLVKLVSDIPTVHAASYYAGIVREKAILRSYIRMASDIVTMCYEQSEETPDIIQKAESGILSVNTKTTQSQMHHIKDLVEDAIYKMDSRTMEKGLQTGFIDLDKKFRINDGDLVIIAGRPSMGKTAIALNIAEYVSNALPVAIFSMEMKKEIIIDRLFASKALVDSSKLKQGKLDEGEMQDVISAASDLQGDHLWVDDATNISPSEIASKCRHIKKDEGKLGLVVVDHLTEMWRPKKGDDRAEHEENVRQMKRLARELSCPVILLQQLNRGVEARSDKRPVLSDLKETGASEEVADVVILLYRDEYYNPETAKKGIAEVIVAKGRDFGTGTVELAWIPQYMKFANLAKSN